MGLSRRTIDYCRFTIKEYTSVRSVLDRLGFAFEQVDWGRWRYRQGAFACGHAVEVFWEGSSPDMGICVSISGEGCRLVEQSEGFTNWQDWVKSWLELGAKYTRLDLAIDDEDGNLKFEDVHESIKNRDYVCRANRWGLHESHAKRGTGRTLYVGSRQSMAMLRVYDRGFKIKAGYSFLRFEWEFTKDRADVVAKCLAVEGWDKAFGCCRGFIDFTSPEDRHIQPCKRKRARWWVRLVQTSRHVLNVSKVVQESIARSFGWIKRQCSQTLYALTEVQGGAVDWLYELMQEASRKPNDKVKRLISCGAGSDPSLLFAGS